MIGAALLLSMCAVAGAAEQPRPEAAFGSAHVRFDNARIAEVYGYASRRSPTLRRLVSELDASDCIVYVQPGRCAGRSRPSCLANVTSGKGVRYLGILITPSKHMPVAAELLAHELQHALEVARAPEAVDPPSIERLYQRIGFSSCAPGMPSCWETRDAQDTGRVVLQEMMQPRQTAGLIDDTYFGTWTLDAARSLADAGSASSGCLKNADRGYGLISSVTTMVAADGVSHREAFVYRLDGREYVMSAPNEQPRRTIAVTPTDRFNAEFTIRENGIVVAAGRWIVAFNGLTLVEQTLHFGNDGAETTTVTMWRKEGERQPVR